MSDGNWTMIVPYLTKASICSVGCDEKHAKTDEFQNPRHSYQVCSHLTRIPLLRISWKVRLL
jgi:hypothetical protein